MSNSSVCPLFPDIDPDDLVWAALTDPVLAGASNPDIMGFAVRLSSFVANVCAVILIRFGTKADASGALRGMLVLSGAEMLCTFIDMAQHKLTRIDGAFTLLIVHSPVFWYYLLWKNVPKVLTTWRACTTRKYHLMADPDLFLSVPILSSWLSLNVVIWVGGRAMYPEDANCPDPYVVGLRASLVFLLQMATDSILGNYIPNFSDWTSFFWFMVIIVVSIYGTRFVLSNWKRKHLKPKNFWRWCRLLFALLEGIFRTHRWLSWILTIYSYYNWAYALGTYVIEPNFEWTYGQALALATTMPAVFPVIRLMFTAIRYVARNPGKFAKTQWLAFWGDVILLFPDSGKLAQRVNNAWFHGQLDISQPDYLKETDRRQALPTTRPATPSTPSHAASDIHLLVPRASSRSSLRSSSSATPASGASSPGLPGSEVDGSSQVGASTTGRVEASTLSLPVWGIRKKIPEPQQRRSETWSPGFESDV